MPKFLPPALAAALLVSACMERAAPVAATPPPSPAAQPPRPAAPSFAGPVLGPDGRCQTVPASGPATIEAGIGECDLVRLKGRDPTDVLLGESGKGQREVQVLYAEPGGRELYFFVDNRLDRILK